MTPWSTILVERTGSLGRITLNRAEARNPLDRTTAEEFLAALEQHLADAAVRSIVVTGAGSAFCAGGDLKQMSAFSDMTGGDAFEWPAPIVAAHKLMLRAGKPVIAAVNGPAYAGGMGLAGMCDVIIAVRSAKFAMPEVKVGLFPMIIVAHLARSIPRKLLWEMMLTGDPIDAEEAHRLGFVNRVVDDAPAMMEAVANYAKKFEQVSPDAVRLGRRAFTLMADLPAEQALEAAQFLNVPLFLGNDLKEGADAFLAKREPAWRLRDDY
jgi:enoyl-CoA hydratase/carnithine racemase